MNRSTLLLTLFMATAAHATPFTGNDARTQGMGNTGVASAPSYAAGQFNPALLSAYSGKVSFSLLLPTAKATMDDNLGFFKHTNDNFIEGDVIESFETVSFEALESAIFGGAGELAVTDVVDLATTNSANLGVAISNGQYDTASNLANSLTSNIATINSKITTIQTELNNFDTAFTAASSGVAGYRGKPLQVLGSLGAAMALPSAGWGWDLSVAMHLSNNAIIGASADIAQSDLDKINNAVADLVSYTGEASDLTFLSSILASETNELIALLATQPDAPTNPASTAAYADWVAANEDAVAAATDNVLIAQANLTAETSASDTDYTLTNGDTEIAEYDGNSIVNYNSENGYFVEGTLDDSQLDGLGDDSSIEVVGANILELGVSIARKFEYRDQVFAVGVTPKLQYVTVFEDVFELNNIEEKMTQLEADPLNYFNTNAKNVLTANIDVGATKEWNDIEMLRGDVRVGLVIKDLIPQNLESKSGTELSIRPKIRIGGTHQTRWTTLSADLDITENKPLKYGVPSRSLGLGAEFNAYNWFKLQAGYRNNLSVTDSHVISGGIGLTPFGVGLEFAAWAKPKSFDDWDELIQDAGLVAQIAMEF